MDLTERTAALDGFTNSRKTRAGEYTPVGLTDGEASIRTGLPIPFFTPRFSRFIHADSRPTRHEWEHNLLCELGEHAACHCGESLKAPVFHEVTNDCS